jgi:hypothetical protein
LPPAPVSVQRGLRICRTSLPNRDESNEIATKGAYTAECL